MRKIVFGVVVATVMMRLSGCGTLLTAPGLISMATTAWGGVAHGAVLGGSALGALHSAGSGDGAITDTGSGLSAGNQIASAPPPGGLADSYWSPYSGEPVNEHESR
jgi:hypothetical protein